MLDHEDLESIVGPLPVDQADHDGSDARLQTANAKMLRRDADEIDRRLQSDCPMCDGIRRLRGDHCPHNG
jgi:hypothetical protein